MPKIEDVLKATADEVVNHFMGKGATVSKNDFDFVAQKITQLLEEKERQARTQLLSEIVEKMPKGRDMYKAKDFDGINNENLRRWNLIRTGYNDCIADILNIIKEIEHE